MTTSPGKVRRPPPRGGHDIEVLEKNTDTSWAMFQSLQQQHERGYEKTRPISLDPPPPLAVPGKVTLEAVLVEARRLNRVCPTPVVWQRLYDYLPNKAANLPPVPATRAEWDQLPPLQKRSRLREHIEWAAAQGVLKQVYDALRALPESRWHHMGD